METTFSVLKQKNQKLVLAQMALRRKLWEATNQFVRAYTDSLSLPGACWTDLAGESHSYVEVGDMPSPGEFFPRAVTQLKMGEDCFLHFTLITTIDDSPGTTCRMATNIALGYEGDNLIIQVGSDKDMARLQVLPESGDFADVCTVIKRNIIREIENAAPPGVQL